VKAVKGSFKLHARRQLNRSEAWACFTANLALPGSGSLAAGRGIGYLQMAAAFAGMILTIVTAIPMFQWVASGGGTPSPQSMDDPIQAMTDLWIHARGPLAGIGLFAASILWALVTSLAILAGAPKQGGPPKIG
jgi:hypothetical protein